MMWYTISGMKKGVDSDLLIAAIAGYERQVQDINEKMTVISARLKGKSPLQTNGVVRKKHRISAEGRARIAAAQRKRWATRKKAAA